MATSQMNEVMQHLRRTVLLPDGAGLTDGRLLGCFIEHRDEAAFAALVRRHGPMVWGVCRRLLNQHDADDAFQATFLVLVRKAASIMPRERIANWLYGVAHRTALQAKRTAARRRAKEKQVTMMPEPAVMEQDLWRDLQPLLDQELSLLPHAYREVIVFSDLEGKTRKEVARQLGLPEGTVGSRLARARTMLAKRLSQRGVALSGGGLAAVLAQQAVAAGVPNSVVDSTIKAANLLAAGKAAAAGAISVTVAALTEGVMKTMALAKLKAAGLVLLVATLVLSGGMVSYHLLERDKTPFPGNGIAAPVNPEDDVKMYGSAAGAVQHVMRIRAARQEAVPGVAELLQWYKQLYQEWKAPVAKRSADRLPPQMAELQPWLAKSQPGDRTFALEAKLDPKRSEWTIIGVTELGGPEVAFELDWKFVVRFTPSTERYEIVGEEYFGANGERVPNEWDGFADPVRYGLRPVGKKDGKGGGP